MMTLPRTEHNLGPLSEIPPGEGREFIVAGDPVAVFHTRAGAVYATQALCPHRSGPLIDGLIGGTTLLCPFHAWKFDLRTGEALMGQCGLQTYPVRLEAGQIVLTLGPAEAGHQVAAPEGGQEIGIDQTPVGSHTGPALSA